MAYTKQTFTSGQTLKASDLNTMSQGIVDKQDKLVSGTSIKTINGQSLLGSGNLEIQQGDSVVVDNALSETSENPIQNKAVTSALNNKQATLVSGTSIKTVNGQSLLGSGNITIQGGDTIVESGTLGAKYAGLYGKKISFLGDSITTFNGYIPNGYAHFYPRNNITSVEKTWWWQFTKTCGLDILVNASWSGSCVTTSRNGSSSENSTSAAMGCSNKRIADLAKDGVTPDIVICFIGC